jgi:ankyrin repeat protein
LTAGVGGLSRDGITGSDDMASADERENAAGTALQAALRTLLQAIAVGDDASIAQLLQAAPALALAGEPVGATRASAQEHFLAPIGHHVYAGDTALHLAAASHRPAIVERLLSHGADPSARNRRGAEPLHYAADRAPGQERWDPEGQVRVIEQLLAAGAAPDVRDRSGVTPLHRAVRTRSAAAVRALLVGGAEARLPNGNGSTPLHLAVRDTGLGGSESPEARAQQRVITELLQEHGARATDRDGAGRTVRECARTPWILELLA